MPKRQSKRAEVGFGQVAIAPRVDDPRGFAVHNLTSQRILVTFSYDSVTHVQTVHIEGDQPPKVMPDETAGVEDGSMPTGIA